MNIDIFDNDITIEDIPDGVPHATACRGVIEKDGKYLVVHVKKHDITTFPGGGLEPGETLEECCKREVLEETGIKCNIIAKTVTVNEYFMDCTWTTEFFKCEFVEDTFETSYTEEELDIQMEVEWRTLDELLDTFENNMTLHPHGPNIHNREFLGLINSI